MSLLNTLTHSLTHSLTHLIQLFGHPATSVK